jgi:hypothetical protein
VVIVIAVGGGDGGRSHVAYVLDLGGLQIVVRT